MKTGAAWRDQGNDVVPASCADDSRLESLAAMIKTLAPCLQYPPLQKHTLFEVPLFMPCGCLQQEGACAL